MRGLVRQGHVHMALMSRNDASPVLADMDFTRLFHDDFVAVVPEGHALSPRKGTSFAELARHPLLLNPKGVDLREMLERLFHAEALVPRVAQELIGTHALVALVAAGFGVSIQPRMALSGLDMQGCSVLKLRGGAGREIGVMLPARRSHAPATHGVQGVPAEQGKAGALHG
ncbi:LysR family transcriptional regulator substrate-binding protein [Ramlibacter terrae]|uniref:LysR family transcriptional regulator substrate-binding protein n=1 Tax=Ramlibacter terrae TaxID=2732511 RepID=A0ABX6NZY9_9BURK|nr:LysR family transcriptional regulator substrate-binding protein [Ramlibacter terrae]